MIIQNMIFLLHILFRDNAYYYCTGQYHSTFSRWGFLAGLL